MAKCVAILTRFQPQNEEIIRGINGIVVSISMPLFQLLETDKKKEALDALRSAKQGDAILFVSPSAACFAKKLMPTIAKNVFVLGPGVATQNKIKELWPEASLIENRASVVNSGSEAVTEILLKTDVKRVFVVRAQSGREYLSQSLSASGIEVRPVEVYQRIPAEMDKQTRAQLSQAINTMTPILYVASSEAISVLMKNICSIEGMLSWLQSGVVLTIHPRIVTKLNEAGFKHVELTDSASTVVAKRICELNEQLKFSN